jgi:large subunit ribosomal protein L10
MSIRDKNRKLLQRYIEMLEDAKAIYFAEIRAVKANDVVDLKKRLKEEGANFTMVKNTVFKIAFEEARTKEEIDDLVGQYGVVTTGDEVVTPAKYLKEFGDKYEDVDAAFGFLDNKKIDGSKIWQLADLPSKDQLLGQLVGTMSAPVRDFMSVANGPARDFVGVLRALKDEKEE